MHIHVVSTGGTAKFWVEPIVSLADYYKTTSKELKELKKIIEEKQDEIIKLWKKHFEQ